MNTKVENKISSLCLDDRFENLNLATKEQFRAMKQKALDDGELLTPIVVWREQNMVVFGSAEFRILLAHPDLKHTIKEREFKDWQDASVWATEHHISNPSLTLFRKLELAFQCEKYWKTKEKARLAQGIRNDLSTESVQKSPRIDILQIVAEKVGCSRTTAAHAKKILNNPALADKCRREEMSIDAAYNKLNKKKTDNNTGDGNNGKGNNTENKSKSKDYVMVLENCDIFEECEKNIDVGRKNIRKFEDCPVDPKAIADQMHKTKIPDGGIWVVLYRDKNIMQVVKKSYNEKKGKYNIKVNSYRCHIVPAPDGVAIFESEHLNIGTSEYLRADESEFDERGAA